jgi:glycosyltransferase involved in cell wall biosynthesis
MRVLQICHSYYPPFLDCARQYAALFAGTPYKVLTVYLTGEYSAEVVEGSASDEVIFLGYKSSDVSGLKLGAIAKIKAICNKESFLFCIAHRVKPTYVALLATNLPIISVHHNYNDYSRWSRRQLVNCFKNRILMLGVSGSVRDDLRRDLKNWPAECIQTLYNRIDVDAVKAQLLDKTKARKALNLPQAAFVVGNVGRLHHDKDQKTLITGFAKALPKLPSNSLLIIMGAGPLESELKQKVSQLSLEKNIIFTGNLPNAKQYFKAFDVFALTSDREPFGMVLLEAMAAEIPIICSDCGGGAEIVCDVGDLFKFGDDNVLGQSLLKHYQKPVTNNQAALKKLNELFTDSAAKKYFWQLNWIESIVQGKQ